MAMFPGELKEASQTVAISQAKIGRWQLTVYLHVLTISYLLWESIGT